MQILTEDRKQVKIVLKNLGRKKTPEEIFYDLCFCICAPQTTFKANRRVCASLISKDFFHKNIALADLRTLVKPARFLRKADYLLDAKKNFMPILSAINPSSTEAHGHWSPEEKRDWLIKNVYGLGMKAASHFLRNLGNDSLAIIDTHILKYLQKPQPKSNKEYLQYECLFKDCAKAENLTVAELDAIIWKTYSKTEWKDFGY